MSKRYVKCITSAGKRYITTGKEYEVINYTRDCITVVNSTGEQFAYPAQLFSPMYLKSVLGEHKWADVIHAWADGAAIQFLYDEGGKGVWADVLYPSWRVAEHNHYRIKPLIDTEAIAKATRAIKKIQQKRNVLFHRISDDKHTMSAHDASLSRLRNNLSNLESGENPDD